MTMRNLSRRRFLTSGLQAGGATLLSNGFAKPIAAQNASAAVRSGRERWLQLLEQVSDPVLQALSQRELRKRMPVEAVAGHEAERAIGSQLEAFARLLAGLAPWLELHSSPQESAHETALRAKYRIWAQQAIASALDPDSPDYMRFGESGQTLVDASFLSLALLRAPTALLNSMDAATRQRLIAALEKERTVQSPFSNWLLFAALNEVLLRKLGVYWDRLRIDYALKELEAWYLGDGTYGDGPHYHADFYNSYVMHPYLLAVLDEVGNEPTWKPMAAPVLERARRYAAIQERMISAAGEFPLLGRSITYRAGAFHLLAEIARRHALPAEIQPAAVRCALATVQERTLSPAETFTATGWLQIGLAGHQPQLAETYISTGSLYLCSAAWLPLGLPPGDPFWASADAAWTQRRVWSGGDAHADHALSD